LQGRDKLGSLLRLSTLRLGGQSWRRENYQRSVWSFWSRAWAVGVDTGTVGDDRSVTSGTAFLQSGNFSLYGELESHRKSLI